MAAKNPNINKARYWVAVLYLENMVDGWREVIDDLLELPFAYCVHNADVDSKSEHRKDHVHIILAFPNTTTYKHAMEVFNLLSAPGKKALNTCQAVINIRSKYDYLIHDTKKCREQGKHLYPATDRITGNGFDIGAYEQISQEEKNELLREMLDFIIDNGITNIAAFYVSYEKLSDPRVFDVFKSYGSLVEKMCKGNFHGNSGVSCASGTRQAHETRCPECGSADIKKKGKTAADQQRYQCKECGKTFV